MKTLETSFASRVRLYLGALIAMLLAGSVVQSEAQITNITKIANGHVTSVGFDPNSGLDYWTINGVNQLSQESFYFNSGSGVTELNNSMIISESVSHTASPSSGYNELSVAYDLGSGFEADFTYVLGIAGNNYSLTPTIYIYNNNLSGSANISFYQFATFVLGNASGSQNVQMSTITPGSQYQAYQTGGGASLTDLVQPITPVGVTITTEMQADSGAPFGPSNISANPLDTNPLAANQLAGSGSVDFAYEWDVTGLQAGTSFEISESSETITVPEPSSMALVASGIFALALMSRRRISKKA